MQELFRTGAYSEVIARSQQLENQATAQGNDCDTELACILEDVARAYYELGDFQSAIQTTKRVLRIDSQCGDDADRVRSLANLGRLYLSAGQQREGELALEEAMALLDRSRDCDQVERSTVLLHLASLAAVREEYEKAQRLLTEAAQLRLYEYHWLHPKYAIVFVHFSRLYRKMGMLQASAKCLQKAIRIYKQAGQEGTIQYAKIVAELAQLQIAQGDLVSAEASIASAANVLRKSLVTDHPQLVALERQLRELRAHARA